MQTFLPFPSFVASAAVLDDRRLGKQRVETFQILRALVFPTYGWKNHPAVAMWRGFTPALVGYGLTVCLEWERRGYADAVAGQLLRFCGPVPPGLPELRAAGALPPWLGTETVHRSHRAALLSKEPAYYGELFGGQQGIDPDLPADLPYDWPAPLFPRWPVRRDGAALSIPEALAAAQLDTPEASGTVTRALTGLAGGDPIALGPLSDRHALAVVLAVQPPALWLTGNPDVRPDAPAPFPLPDRGQRPPGRLAASIARPPSPADETAMAAEAASELGIVVHPMERLADARIRDRLDAAPPSVVVTPGPEGMMLASG